MKTSVIAGVVLAVLVVFWTLVMGFTGWYKSPTMVAAFFLVIPINIGVVIWGLRKTAREGRGYGGQIAAALVMGVVASVFIFANSFVFTTVLFPTYFDDLRAVQAELLKAAGQSDKEIEG